MVIQVMMLITDLKCRLRQRFSVIIQHREQKWRYFRDTTTDLKDENGVPYDRESCDPASITRTLSTGFPPPFLDFEKTKERVKTDPELDSNTVGNLKD